MKQFKYPPCGLNPKTERPYTRHKWEIIDGAILVKDGVYFHKVRCQRKGCQINDPNPVRF